MHLKKSLLLIPCVIALTASTALAADGHGTNWTDLVFRVLTTVVVLGILWRTAGKRIAAYFRQRHDNIVDDFSSLESRRESAKQELANVEHRIANLEAERKAILDEYRAQGELLKQEIIAKAEKAAAQMAEQARRTADNELAQALAALRSEVADEIVQSAERLLRERMSQADHDRLIDDALKKVVLQ